MFQPYLDTLNLARLRICLSRSRLPSHRLFIVTGRWRKPVSVPIDDRKCIDCNILEDEYHFVLECINYSDLRKQLIPQYYYRRPNMYKVIE